jgi:hypothetical protein
MTRIAVFCLFFAFFFASCEDGADVFEKWNSEPKITIYKGESVFESLRDTLKIGFPKVYSFSIEDEENLNLSFVPNDNLSVSIDNVGNTFVADGYAQGLQTLTVSCTDGFNVSHSVDIKLFCFSNWNPIAILFVSVINGYEVQIDARNSYDADGRFGGGLVKFEYVINDITYQSDKNLLNYVYGSPGLKTIKLRVQDNDLVWSEWVTVYFTLN